MRNEKFSPVYHGRNVSNLWKYAINSVRWVASESKVINGSRLPALCHPYMGEESTPGEGGREREKERKISNKRTISSKVIKK